LNVVISHLVDELDVILKIGDKLAINAEDDNDEGASF